MLFRSIAFAAALATAFPAAFSIVPADAAQTVKKSSASKSTHRYKKNFRGTRPGEPNYAELPDNCWGAKWDRKDWLCLNHFGWGWQGWKD
jgi:hypothetical protein